MDDTDRGNNTDVAYLDFAKAFDAILDSAPETDQYDLDGGSLLFRLTWNQGDTYGSIANAYSSLTTRNCGTAIMMDVMDHRLRTTPTSAANGMRRPELWLSRQNGYSQEQRISS